MGLKRPGLGVDAEYHAATDQEGRPGVLHGSLMDVLKMPMVKFLKPSLSRRVWTILVSVQEHSPYHDIKRAL